MGPPDDNAYAVEPVGRRDYQTIGAQRVDIFAIDAHLELNHVTAITPAHRHVI